MLACISQALGCLYTRRELATQAEACTTMDHFFCLPELFGTRKTPLQPGINIHTTESLSSILFCWSNWLRLETNKHDLTDCFYVAASFIYIYYSFIYKSLTRRWKFFSFLSFSQKSDYGYPCALPRKKCSVTSSPIIPEWLFIPHLTSFIQLLSSLFCHS